MPIAAMIVTIVVIDQLFWRPLVAWAEKFKFEQTGGQGPHLVGARSPAPVLSRRRGLGARAATIRGAHRGVPRWPWPTSGTRWRGTARADAAADSDLRMGAGGGRGGLDRDRRGHYRSRDPHGAVVGRDAPDFRARRADAAARRGDDGARHARVDADRRVDRPAAARSRASRSRSRRSRPRFQST